MVEDLIQWESVAGVFLQDAWDEFLCSRGKSGWQVVPDFLYTLVGLLQVKSLKRRVATHQCVPMWDKSKANGQIQRDTKEKIYYKRQPWLDKASNSHDTSEGPDVRLCAVALSVEHLRSQVIGSPTDCSKKKKYRIDLTPQKYSTYFLFCRCIMQTRK